MTRLPLAALVLALAQPAEAMDYGYHLDRGYVVIEAHGEIELDERQRFDMFLAGLPGDVLTQLHQPGNAIVFSSRGGWISGAWYLAQAIEAMALNTGVATGGQCSSACVMAWAVGQHKSVPERGCLGVHQGTPRGTAEQAPTSSAEDITSFMAQWLTSHAAPATVIDKLNATPSNAIACLSDGDLAAWGAKIISERTGP